MSSQLEILDANEPTARARWIDLWHQWPRREVQAHPAYLEQFAGAGELARAAIFRSAVLYPFLQRVIPGTNASDLTSAYGYGGAYAWGDDREQLGREFWSVFEIWARETGVIAEFMRVAVGTRDLLPYPGEQVRRQDNVIIPTDVAPDVAWSRYAHKVRKNVNKARSAGVRIAVDQRGERLDAFLRIYLATMSRRNASSSYHFSEAFFRRLDAALPDNIVYFHAIHGDEVISTELALVSVDRIYSFLGGTDERFFDLRPNDLLKHEMVTWAHEHGRSQFVLGGGFRPDDGIFQYKKAFAPEGVVAFFTGQRVYNQERYDQLVAERHAELGAPLASGFFPAYRAPAAS
ncbi:MAG TPA: GNAT family N-acetyltransferase [Kofleriaceae bacterium]|jgi:hypothetical protein